jgi:hypothetical protein
MVKSPKWQHYSLKRGEMGLINQMIIEEITNWDLVELLLHPFGGVDIRIKRKSIGHMHGDNLIDLPKVRPIGWLYRTKCLESLAHTFFG